MLPLAAVVGSTNVCNQKLVEVTEVPEADQREGAFLTLVLLGWLSSASYPSQRSLNLS